jgi:MFS family permease
MRALESKYGEPNMIDERPAKGANWILILLVVINIINMVDRNLISSFGPEITAELNLSDTQFGYLTGLLFVFFYALMGLFVGRLADIVHRPRLIAAGLLVWSVLTVVSGAARSFLQIAIARLFIGVGESCLSPSAMSMLSDLYPQNRRGMATGMYYLGLPLGAGASFIVAGIFGPQIGWRNCFYIIGAFGVLLTPLLFFMKDPIRGQFDTQAKAEPASTGVVDSVKKVWTLVRATPALAWAMIGAVFMHLPIGAAQFVQLWLVRERGFESAEIATIYGGLFIVFGTLGAFIGGMLSDWYLKRFRGGRLRFLAVFMLMVTPLMVGYRFSEPGSMIFYIGMCAGFVSFIAFYGPVFSTVQDLSPANLRGSVTAFLLLVCNLVGLGLGAVITGVLSDYFSSIGVEDPLTMSLLSVDLVGVMTLISFFVGSFYWQKMQDQNLATSV